MTRIDKRIAELQQRLHRKRLLNQQLANQINAATSAKQAQMRASNQKNRVRPISSNIAAVEPFQHTPNENVSTVGGSATCISGNGGGGGGNSQQERAMDDLHTKLNSNSAIAEELPEFHPNKNDPKYQTLPYNTKFGPKYGAGGGMPTPETGPLPKGGNVVGPVTSEDSNNIAAPKKVDEKPPQVMDQSSVVGTANGRPVGPPPSPPLPANLAPQTVHSIPAYAPSKAHATAVPQGKSLEPGMTLGSHPPPPPITDSTIPQTAGRPPTSQQQMPTVSSSSSGNHPLSRHYGASYSAVVMPGRVQYSESTNLVAPSGQLGSASSQSSSALLGSVSTQSSGKPPMLVAPPYIPPPSTNTTTKIQNNNSGGVGGGVVGPAEVRTSLIPAIF